MQSNNPESFLAAVQSGALVLDGAMGTQLNALGMSFDKCFELANVEQPQWVTKIHQDFIAAGARGIHSNTFAANRYKLANHDVRDRLSEVVCAAVRLAKDAAEDQAWVIGAVGPLGVEVEPLGRVSREEARNAFIEVVEILSSEGVDAISFETFSSIDELVEAVSAAKQVCDLPVIAQFVVDREARTTYGTTMATAAERLTEAGADILGVNCSGGPRTVLNAAQKLLEVTNLPVAARPNAGLPRQIDGRVFYENNPDYFARFGRRFFQSGGRLLGGCCGTTPEHVRAMSRAAQAGGAQQRGASEIKFSQQATPSSRKLSHKATPLAQRSPFGALLAAGRCPVSVELVPPRTPDMSKLCASGSVLQQAGADLINLPDGPRASARVSNFAAAVILQRELKIETLLHFCCRDRNLLGMQSDLMGAAALGLHNLLLITGDPPYQGNYPDLTAVFDVDSIGLGNIVDNLNHGLDLGGNDLGCNTNFVFGGALNHTAIDQARELERFAWKIKTGINYAITQPIFDAESFLDFSAQLPNNELPILASVWPLRSLRNAEFLASEVPGVYVPPSIIERMRVADNNGRAADEGLAIAQDTIKSLFGKVGGFQLAAPFNHVAAPVALLETINHLR